MSNFSIIKFSNIADKNWVDEQQYISRIPVPKANQVIYQTTDHEPLVFKTGEIYERYKTVIDKYADLIVSNVYDKSKEYGIITYSEDLDTLGGFLGQERLTNVYYSSNITCIDTDAFMICPALQSFNISENITEIKNYAFAQSGLTEITIPNTVNTINMGLFNHCKNLTSCIINANITELPQYLFTECENLQNIIVKTDTITKFGQETFKGCTFKSFTVPLSVTEIGQYCFQDCANLEEIIFSDGVETIQMGAFKNCTSLKRLELPSTLKDLRADFITCTSLEYIKIKSDVINNVNSAPPFNNLKNLSTIVFEEGVTTISSRLCENAIGLKNVSLPSTLRTIESQVFKDCSSLTTLKLPDGLTTINNWAFQNSGIEELIIPESLSTISDNSFQNIDNCKRFIFKNTKVTKVFSSNTLSASKLEYLEFESETTNGALTLLINLKTLLLNVHGEAGTILNGCPSLETLIIGEHTTSIAYGTLSTCSKLERFEIPSTLESINNALDGCGVKSLVIPETCTVQSSFKKCPRLEYLETHMDDFTGSFSGSFGKLKTLILNHDGVVTGLDTHIDDMKNFINIYVPKAHIEDYKETYPTISGYFRTIEIQDYSDILPGTSTETDPNIQSVIAYNNFISGTTKVDTLENTPIEHRLIIATLTKSETLSLEEDLPAGRDLHIIANNDSDEIITISFPEVLGDSAATMDVNPHEIGEITVISDGTNLYLRHF